MTAQILPHTPFSSMGCDAADVDGDGLVDLFVADMAGRTHEEDQRTLAPSRYSRKKLDPHGARQISQNALFLANRLGRVREAAYLSGLAESDWTWSPRFEDFDEDGKVDLFVTTGMNREHHNLDLIARTGDAASMGEKISILKASPVFNEKSLAFRNEGKLKFTEVGQAWGLDDNGVSFGAATGDLDGDGDLDIIVSNYNRPPTVYRNNSVSAHRIIFSLRGTKSNRFGIGAIVTIKTKDGTQAAGLWSARGYQSTSEPIVHFGLGAATHVDRVEVRWPSGYINTWENLLADRKYVLEEKGPRSIPDVERTLFDRISGVSVARSGSFDRTDANEKYRLAPWKIEPRDDEAMARLCALISDEGPGVESQCTELLEKPDSVVETIGASALSPGGNLVLFVGRRSSLGRYPEPAESSLLVKENGSWRDRTEELAPTLKALGNVTASLWSDFDNDGLQDLIVTTEWGIVHCLHNEHGERFVDVSERIGFAQAGKGWWRSLASGDFNHDGRMDYIAGNVGLNTQYEATETHPALLLYKPAPSDGKVLIEAYYENETLFPWRSRNDIVSQFPAVGRKLRSNDIYAKTGLAGIFGASYMTSLKQVSATQLQSGVFLSQPDGTYRFSPLPREAQIAPAQAVVATDFNADGHTDIYIAQNSSAPKSAPWDGGVGQLLLGDGTGGFVVVPPQKSGLVTGGASVCAAVFDANRDGWPDLAVAQSNDPPVVFQNRGVASRSSFSVSIQPAGRPGDYTGTRIEALDPAGHRQLAEVTSHAGHVTRNQPIFFFGRARGEETTLKVRWPDGSEKIYDVAPSAKALTVGRN